MLEFIDEQNGDREIREINGTARNLIRIFVAAAPDRRRSSAPAANHEAYPRDGARTGGNEHIALCVQTHLVSTDRKRKGKPERDRAHLTAFSIAD